MEIATVIKGRTVELFERIPAGVDPFGYEVFAEVSTLVSNVLIQPTSDSDAINDLNLYGKKSTYALHIPKGDTHKWTDTKVCFFGHTWRTFGDVTEYQEELLPLDWKGYIKVERYE